VVDREVGAVGFPGRSRTARLVDLWLVSLICAGWVPHDR
jgi:hypothetical protein